MKDAWAARSSFLEGIEEQTKLLDECDVVVPVTKIPDYVLFADQLAQGYDFRLQYFGHAGDGNLHIYCCANDMGGRNSSGRWTTSCPSSTPKPWSWAGRSPESTASAGEGEVPGPGGGPHQPGPDAGHQAGV